LSAVLEQTKDVDIDSLRMRINQARADEREILELQGQIKANERLLGARLAELKKQKDQIVKKVGKKDAAENRLTAADDILRIIVTTIEALGEDTLNEVSTVMNDIFQKINVQDEADQSVIISVGISQDHEIVVNGINGKRLVPSTDISGAQKRALTLAFIFATVQVSGRELPNIIDTPLGTQSGELKRLMLEYTALNTKQAILFLTSSEIAGVEDVIRKYTDKYWTLTHADHYPRELINKPPVSTKSAYICACDIQSSCVLCARKGGDK
jgi:DNA sulfur modification protein DndD